MTHKLIKIRQKNRLPDLIASVMGLSLLLLGTHAFIGAPTTIINIIIYAVIILFVLLVSIHVLRQDKPVYIDTQNSVIQINKKTVPINNITGLKFDMPISISYFVPLIIIEFLDTTGKPLFKLESLARHSTNDLMAVKHVIDNAALPDEHKKFYDTWLERKSISYLRLHKNKGNNSKKSEQSI